MTLLIESRLAAVSLTQRAHLGDQLPEGLAVSLVEVVFHQYALDDACADLLVALGVEVGQLEQRVAAVQGAEGDGLLEHEDDLLHQRLRVLDDDFVDVLGKVHVLHLARGLLEVAEAHVRLLQVDFGEGLEREADVHLEQVVRGLEEQVEDLLRVAQARLLVLFERLRVVREVQAQARALDAREQEVDRVLPERALSPNRQRAQEAQKVRREQRPPTRGESIRGPQRRVHLRQHLPVWSGLHAGALFRVSAEMCCTDRSRSRKKISKKANRMKQIVR